MPMGIVTKFDWAFEGEARFFQRLKRGTTCPALLDGCCGLNCVLQDQILKFKEFLNVSF